MPVPFSCGSEAVTFCQNLHDVGEGPGLTLTKGPRGWYHSGAHSHSGGVDRGTQQGHTWTAAHVGCTEGLEPDLGHPLFVGLRVWQSFGKPEQGIIP